jgi:hypothetical protein
MDLLEDIDLGGRYARNRSDRFGKGRESAGGRPDQGGSLIKVLITQVKAAVPRRGGRGGRNGYGVGSVDRHGHDRTMSVQGAILKLIPRQ